jgi:hypothetical protein
LLKLESNVLKSKIDHYMVSLSIHEDKKKQVAEPADKVYVPSGDPRLRLRLRRPLPLR